MPQGPEPHPNAGGYWQSLVLTASTRRGPLRSGSGPSWMIDSASTDRAIAMMCDDPRKSSAVTRSTIGSALPRLRRWWIRTSARSNSRAAADRNPSTARTSSTLFSPLSVIDDSESTTTRSGCSS